jgi:hypothetical protein
LAFSLPSRPFLLSLLFGCYCLPWWNNSTVRPAFLPPNALIPFDRPGTRPRIAQRQHRHWHRARHRLHQHRAQSTEHRGGGGGGDGDLQSLDRVISRALPLTIASRPLGVYRIFSLHSFLFKPHQTASLPLSPPSRRRAQPVGCGISTAPARGPLLLPKARPAPVRRPFGFFVLVL